MKPKHIVIGGTFLVAGFAAMYVVVHSVRDATPEPVQIKSAATSVPTQFPRLSSQIEKKDRATDFVPNSLGNQIERSDDLRSIFERNRNSKNISERNLAYRAWISCIPAFVAPDRQAISPVAIAQSLPPSVMKNDEKRLDAIRLMQTRCRNFGDLTSAETLTISKQQQDAWKQGDVLAPGELAIKYLNDGETERALMAARTIVTSKDPYGISSLREFINQYQAKQIEAKQDHGNEERPDLQGLAFSIVACQTGLDCGEDSLTALQLCTNNGQCSGNVIDRYLAALPSQADREIAIKESGRISEAIRSGNMSILGL